MPNCDKTGPNGQGPKTGQGKWKCVSSSDWNNIQNNKRERNQRRARRGCCGGWMWRNRRNEESTNE